MVKVFYFLKRRSDISPAEFHRYWRDHHGPMFTSSAIARRYCVRYEQNHATAENAEIGADEFDGVSVMWFRSVEDVHAMRADSEFREVVVADGEHFLDTTATKVMLTFAEEPVVIAVEQ
jgi:uncharacterized protein (TIGR02118 family)